MFCLVVCFGVMFPEQPTVTRNYCQVARIIRPSRKDTPKTKRAILRHNLTYRRVCKK